MAHAGGQTGHGMNVGFSASSPVSWTAIPEVLDASVPSFIADSIDITTHDTAGGYKKNLSGLKTVSDIQVSCLADFINVAAYNTLIGYNKDGTIIWLRIEVPANEAETQFKAWECQVQVKGVEVMSPIAGRQELKYTFNFAGNDVGMPVVGSAAVMS